MNENTFYYVLGKKEVYSPDNFDLLSYTSPSFLASLNKYDESERVLFFDYKNKVSLAKYKKNNSLTINDFLALLSQLAEVEIFLHEYNLDYSNLILRDDSIFVKDTNKDLSKKNNLPNSLLFTYLPIINKQAENGYLYDRRIKQSNFLLDTFLNLPEVKNINFRNLSEDNEKLLKDLILTLEKSSLDMLFFFKEREKDLQRIFPRLQPKLADKNTNDQINKQGQDSFQIPNYQTPRINKINPRKETKILPDFFYESSVKKSEYKGKYVNIALQFTSLILYIILFHHEFSSRGIVSTIINNNYAKLATFFLLILAISNSYILKNSYLGKEQSVNKKKNKQKNMEKKEYLPKNNQAISLLKPNEAYYFAENISQDIFKSSFKKVEFSKFPFILANDFTEADGLFLEDVPFYFNLLLQKKKNKIFVINHSDYPIYINQEILAVGEKTELKPDSALNIQQNIFYFQKSV